MVILGREDEMVVRGKSFLFGSFRLAYQGFQCRSVSGDEWTYGLKTWFLG